MKLATRSLLRRWYREPIQVASGTKRRRAMLAKDRRERATRRHPNVLARDRTRLDIQNASLHRRNTELDDKLKALHDRVPVYTRIQRDEQWHGRMFVIPVAFNPDIIIRTLVRSLPSRLDALDLNQECHHLADFASKKILDALQKAAAEYFGISGAPR